MDDAPASDGQIIWGFCLSVMVPASTAPTAIKIGVSDIKFFHFKQWHQRVGETYPY